MMNIDEIFEIRQRRKPKPKKTKTYDVGITINKNGKGGFAIRFGFLNEAVNAFAGNTYIQVSRVDKLPNRIYFRLFTNKANLDAHKLCTNSKSETSNLYTAITPSEAAGKIYRAKWIGKTFKIKHDDEYDLYYIEQEAE